MPTKKKERTRRGNAAETLAAVPLHLLEVLVVVDARQIPKVTKNSSTMIPVGRIWPAAPRLSGLRVGRRPGIGCVSLRAAAVRPHSAAAGTPAKAGGGGGGCALRGCPRRRLSGAGGWLGGVLRVGSAGVLTESGAGRPGSGNGT